MYECEVAGPISKYTCTGITEGNDQESATLITLGNRVKNFCIHVLWCMHAREDVYRGRTSHEETHCVGGYQLHKDTHIVGYMYGLWGLT